LNLPSPTNGLNYLVPITQQDPKDATVLNDMVPRPYGVELRKGWRVHQDPLGGSVNTLFKHFPAEGLAFSKLFAGVSNGNIYDVTIRGSAPLSLTIPGQEVAGEFYTTNFVTEGESYLCLVSKGGGYWVYTTIGGWVNIPAGTGAMKLEFPALDTTEPTDFAYITVWKNRLWFVKANSGIAYFLPVGQVAGVLEVFDFGPQFKSGGSLEALTSWTVDGGDGIDDKLVVFGGGGDLLIYQGTDPSSATDFSMVGRWFYGIPPYGRRFFSDYGGDTVIVSARGLVFLSELLQFGGKFKDFHNASGKINQVIAASVARTRSQPYWEVLYLFAEQLILFNTPDTSVSFDQQLVYEINSNGFAWFTGMKMNTVTFFDDSPYFGTSDGYVCQALVGRTDGELLDGTPGQTLEGEVQTAWQGQPDPSVFKRYLMVEPYFISTGPPSVKVQVNIDWSFTGTAGSPGFVQPEDSVWDTGLWDVARWAGTRNSYKGWAGCEGLGHFASLRLAIRGEPGTIFTNFVLIAEAGGVL
jgi:hypothetical protein